MITQRREDAPAARTVRWSEPAGSVRGARTYVGIRLDPVLRHLRLSKTLAKRLCGSGPWYVKVGWDERFGVLVIERCSDRDPLARKVHDNGHVCGGSTIGQEVNGYGYEWGKRYQASVRNGVAVVKR